MLALFLGDVISFVQRIVQGLMPQDRGSQSLRFRRCGLINRFGYMESSEGGKGRRFGRVWSTRRKWFAFWAGKAWRRRLPSTGSMLCHSQHTCLPSRRHHWLRSTAFCYVEARNRHRNYSFPVPLEAPVVALPFWHPISQSLLRSLVYSSRDCQRFGVPVRQPSPKLSINRLSNSNYKV